MCVGFSSAGDRRRTLPSAMDEEVSSFAALPHELVANCLRHLGAKDAASAATASHGLHAASLDAWEAVLERDLSGLALELLRGAPHHAVSPLQRYSMAARRAEGLSEMQAATWHRIDLGRHSLPAQEGHSSVLLASRWWLVICGFTESGLNNNVFLCDTWALERKEPLRWRRLRA